MLIYKEQSMLDNLTLPQVEKALQWIAQPIKEPPPKELEEVNDLEWFLLTRMLQELMSEKSQQPLQ